MFDTHVAHRADIGQMNLLNNANIFLSTTWVPISAAGIYFADRETGQPPKRATQQFNTYKNAIADRKRVP